MEPSNEPLSPQERLFEDEDPHTVGQTIRTYFKKRGGLMTMHALAGEIIDQKIIPAGVIERCALRGVTEMCRKALSTKTREGVPFAQPTGAGRSDPWKQLDLFTEAQAFALIRRRVTAIGDDFDELERLHFWCLEKFGSAPEIPSVVMPAGDPEPNDDEEDDEDD